MSYIQLPARRVVELCDEYIQRRNERIAQDREPCIQKAMKPRFWGLLPARTREQAIEHLQEYGMWSDYCLADLTGGAQYEKVLKLQSLAELAGDGTVFVDDDVAWCL